MPNSKGFMQGANPCLCYKAASKPINIVPEQKACKLISRYDGIADYTNSFI